MCGARGETEEEGLINGQEGTQMYREQPSSERGSIYVRLHVSAAMSSKLQRFKFNPNTVIHVTMDS